MKLENIIKRLKNNGFEVVEWEFSHKEVLMCRGTALIDLVDGTVVDTTARYIDVMRQVSGNKSHIYTIENNKKQLTSNYKLGYKDI